MKKELETNWYYELLEDLKKLEFTGIVLTKWNIGKRIAEDELKLGKAEYGSKRIENIAKDVKGSASDLWGCVRFYKKFNTPEKLDAVQELTWREIWHKYLPEGQHERKLMPKDVELPKGKYSIIYADPPWTYYAGGYKNQNQHYDSMSLEEICQLPIGSLAAEDCILFMWVTFPMLDQFVDVLRCWGFEYSTVGFTWIKANKSGKGFFFGLGNWTRANAEICIIATRGSVPREDASISQIIYEPIGEHSEKPAIVKDKIVKLVGDLPRIELFARQKTKGWDVWGNEV